jgi:hypothetical protein
MFVAGSSNSGMVIGSSQNLKLSIPLGLSATAKNDFLSTPSTLPTKRYLSCHLIAPEFITAFIPILSNKKGLVCSFKSYRHATGI